MVTSLALLVLRCNDLAASKAFYEALGLTFRAERHGAGPEHWSAQIGGVVLELYPSAQPATLPERVGFLVSDLQAAIASALERRCAEFEHRGHKQMYWVAPDDDE